MIINKIKLYLNIIKKKFKKMLIYRIILIFIQDRTQMHNLFKGINIFNHYILKINKRMKKIKMKNQMNQKVIKTNQKEKAIVFPYNQINNRKKNQNKEMRVQIIKYCNLI